MSSYFSNPDFVAPSPESLVQSFLVVCHTFTYAFSLHPSHVTSWTCLLFLHCVSGYFHDAT